MTNLTNINSIIMLLCKGMLNRKLYFSDHPRVEAYADDIVGLANEYFAAAGDSELFIGVIEGNFIFKGKRIFGPSVTGKQLLDLAEILHCGGFILEKGLTTTDLKKFFDISALRTVPVKKIEDTRNLFKTCSITKIKIADPYVEQGVAAGGSKQKAWEGQAVKQGVLSPTIIFQELYNVVSGAYGDAAFGKNVDIDNAMSVSEFMLQYVRSSFADVMQHVHYPDYDSYTVGHSVRVASLAVYIGHKIGWSEKLLLALGTAGLLHDIGKSKIPDEVLLKKGKLTDEEFKTIQAHPLEGTKILMEQKGVSHLDVAACWGHHIRFDGRGYPQQPSWAVRHPVTALLQICDVFEALTAIRPYKDPMTPMGAYAIMLKDEGAFHPGLLATFISMVGLYPPGTYVQLSDKRVGMVTVNGKKIDRPVIHITESQDGAPLPEYDQYELDLSNPKHQGSQIEKLLLEN